MGRCAQSFDLYAVTLARGCHNVSEPNTSGFPAAQSGQVDVPAVDLGDAGLHHGSGTGLDFGGRLHTTDFVASHFTALAGIDRVDGDGHVRAAHFLWRSGTSPFRPRCPILNRKKGIRLLLAVQVEAELFVALSNGHAIHGASRVLYNVFTALPGSFEVKLLFGGLPISVRAASFDREVREVRDHQLGQRKRHCKQQHGEQAENGGNHDLFSSSLCHPEERRRRGIWVWSREKPRFLASIGMTTTGGSNPSSKLDAASYVLRPRLRPWRVRPRRSSARRLRPSGG